MLTRIPKVGEKILLPSGKVHTVLEIVCETIVVYDHWLEKSKEYNRFIARFVSSHTDDGYEYNDNVTIVEPWDFLSWLETHWRQNTTKMKHLNGCWDRDLKLYVYWR